MYSSKHQDQKDCMFIATWEQSMTTISPRCLLSIQQILFTMNCPTSPAWNAIPLSGEIKPISIFCKIGEDKPSPVPILSDFCLACLFLFFCFGVLLFCVCFYRFFC